MEIAALVLAWVLVLVSLLVAVASVVIPVLPGTPVVLLATVLAGWLTGFERVDANIIIWVAVLTAVAIGIDFLGNVIGAQGFGAGRAGIWGGVIGSFVGLIVFPPWGFLLGALLGAVLFELLAGRPVEQAWRAGIGALIGTVAGVAGKVVVLVVMAWVVLGRLAGG